MKSDVVGKMTSDLEGMSRVLVAKRALLRQVHGAMRALPPNTDRQLIKEVFDVSVNPSSCQPARQMRCSMTWSIGWEKTVCAAIQIENPPSSQHLAVISAQVVPPLPDSIIRCLLFDDQSSATIAQPISSVSPGSSALLIVSLPAHSLIRDTLPPNIIVDCRWTSRGGRIVPVFSSLFCSDSPPAESHSIPLRPPDHWRSLTDLPSCDEREASLLLLCVQTSTISRPIPQMTSSDFRSHFEQFDCCDFGEWQLYIGSSAFSGILARSSTNECGVIDTIHSASSQQLDAFCARLKAGTQ